MENFRISPRKYLPQTSGIFGSLRKSFEMIGKWLKTSWYTKQNNIGLFGAVFVSFWLKFTVTMSVFFSVTVKMPKILLFHVTKPKS